MRYLIFDTETTGLIQNPLLGLEKQPKVIEYFGHVFDSETGEISDELDFLCYLPDNLSGPPVGGKKGERVTVQQITGISNAMIAGQPPFKARLPEVATQLQSVGGLIAHNLSYDMDILRLEWRRQGLGEPPFPPVRICTVEQTEWIKGYRLRLTDLHQHLFGEPFEGAHRARVDVQALTRVVIELMDRGFL